MDENETTQWKEESGGECSYAEHSTEETTDSRTEKSFQASKSVRSGYSGQDVFLSHSGKQKTFVRQLYTDLTNQFVSCFFDQDPESLPLTEDFPSRIFEAAKTCKIAVLLLSKEFLESKWPMQELAAFVEAKNTTGENPKPKILPLFFHIPTDALKEEKIDKEKWKQLKISGEKQAQWLEALKAIQRINGIEFKDGNDEVEFREDIVKEIWRILPPSQRYRIPYMQGGDRMCQDVTNFFNKVLPNEKGIRIAGLYGIAGQGKTSLCKAFCNHTLTEFEGRVCHLEFSRGDPSERVKSALQYLTRCPPWILQTLTKHQAEVELYKRLKGQKVLLVLDNITEDSIDEVRDYIRADLSGNSYILLSARRVDFLVKHFKIDSMHVPSLQEDEAIDILLEGTSLRVSTLRAGDKDCALKCANRCLFGRDTARRCQTFHPLALKAFGRRLFSQHQEDLSKWVSIVPGYGLDPVDGVLREAFDNMIPEYRTVFMLLTLYVPPNISPDKVTEWLAITCNEDIWFIEESVEDLRKKAFLEEIEPEIRIHDLYIEFAKNRAYDMRKWLWYKGPTSSSQRQLISKDREGFELARFEQCKHRKSAPRYLKNLCLLQLVHVPEIYCFDFHEMDSLRSITLQNCKDLAEVEGMEKLAHLAWLQISEVHSTFKLPNLSSLEELRYLEINIAGSEMLDQLTDLTPCSYLREINVRCPFLPEFPNLNGLAQLEKVEFSMCGRVEGPLDCTGCVMLQSIVLNRCDQMVSSPVLAGCKKVHKIVLSDCGAVTACPEIDVAGDEPSGLKTLELSISSKAASAPRSLKVCGKLENLYLWNMEELRKLPSFNLLSNLTVLKIGKCGIRELPDLTCCLRFENVYFFSLKYLEKLPSFSSLSELKILNIYNCRRVQDPPDISGCHKLQAFHLVCNDNMKGLPKMHECPELDEINVSWHCKDEVTYEDIDPESCEVDDNFQSCLEYFEDEMPVENLYDARVPQELKEWLWMQEKRWMHRRTMLVKKYFRGVKLFCSVKAFYASYESSDYYRENYITLKLVDTKVIVFPTPDRLCKDRIWLNKVREYCAGRKDIACASAVTGLYAITSVSAIPSSSTAINGPSVPPALPVADNKRKNSNPLPDASLRATKSRVAAHLVNSPCKKSSQGLQMGVNRNYQATQVGCKNAEPIPLRHPMYRVPPVQAEPRMSQLQDHFKTNEKGISIAGLYGLAGAGKTTLAKEFCNLNARKYDGKVLHVEFCGDNALGAQKLALHYLTHSRNSQFEWVTGEDDVRYVFCSLVKGQKVLLVLDNITEDSIAKVREYLGAELGEGSCILLIARSEDVLLENNFNINSESCMCFPGLEEEEALAILLKGTSLKVSMLQPQDRKFALDCANQCYIQDDGRSRMLHPTVLMVFGRHCFSKHGDDLSKWFDDLSKWFYEKKVVERNTCFVICMLYSFPALFMAFDGMDAKSRNIFMLLNQFKPPKFSTDEIMKRLAKIFKEEVEDLFKYGFIEEIEPEIRINHLMEEFAKKLARRWYEEKKAQAFSERYPMQGEARMYQELREFLHSLQPNEKGVRIAGLYGMPGQGKTTLAEAYCKYKYFKRVCHLEFGGVTALERSRLALLNLTGCSRSEVESLTSEDEVRYVFCSLVKGQKVFLVLDNITEDSIAKVREYLGAELGEGSYILLIARSEDVLLNNNFNINSESCMLMPSLTEEEAVNVLLERACLEKSALSLFCQYAFGLSTIPSDPHQVQAECRGFPLHVQEIVSPNYRDGLFNRLKTSIKALNDEEKECFLDVAAFPRRESIPANALLDVWVYVRGMTRDKAVFLLLKFAALHLLQLRRNTRLPSIRDDFLNYYIFSQDDVQRNLALLLVELYNRIHFRRMYVSIQQSDLFQMWEKDKYYSSEAQIVSFHTGAMTSTQRPQMAFPNAEALIIYFSNAHDHGYEYCIPPFLFKMEKLKVLIMHNDYGRGADGREAKFTGLDSFQLPSQLQSLHLEMLKVPSLLERCKGLERLEKIRLSGCGGLGRDTSFDFPGLLECHVESCSDLEKLPEGICSSKSLEVLSITDCCRLRKLPDELGKLGSLKELRLCRCGTFEGTFKDPFKDTFKDTFKGTFKALPPSICNLTKLEILDISETFSETFLYRQEEQSVLMETLGKLAKIPSLRCVICDKGVKKLLESSFRPGLLNFVVV